MISTGVSFACGVTTSSAVYCWGDNEAGTLGDGTFTSSNTPVAVAGGLSFSMVSAGLGHTCGVTTAGAGYCWGYNFYGQLGSGTNSGPQTCVTNGLSCSPIPVAVAGGLSFATVSAGWWTSCGVTVSGAAYCWGSNAHGSLGDGTDWPLVSRSSPVAVLGGLAFAAVYPSQWGSCGLATSGVVYCWGETPNGGVDQCTEYVRPWDAPLSPTKLVACNRRPATLPGGLILASLADWGGKCGITQAGAAYCWGSTPVALGGGHTFAVISASCGVATGGVAYCWGSNLGDGTTNSSTLPVKVAGQP